MKLAAVNERIAAYVPSVDLVRPNVDSVLNKLMTIRSWKSLINFLNEPGVGQLLASRESTPLTGGGLPNCNDYNYEPLTGHLNTWIDKNPDIDLLDELSRDDLISSGRVYETWIPELLSYAEDYRCLLTLSAVALDKAPAPEDMFQVVNPRDYIADKEAADWFDEETKKPFRKGANLRYLRFNSSYWPATDFGPYSLMDDECCFACELDEREGNYTLRADERFGVLGFRIYCGGEDDLHLLVYDEDEMTEAVAKRIACGLIASPAIGKVMWDEDSSFWHSYADLPDEIDGGTFSLVDGFGLASDKFDFTRWQEELTAAVEKAVLSGRVVLCPYCGTPIITKGEKDRVEYCCSSHKTSASKQRRERAIALCLRGVSIRDAVGCIGEEYTDSVERWYEEADNLARMA